MLLYLELMVLCHLESFCTVNDLPGWPVGLVGSTGKCASLPPVIVLIFDYFTTLVSLWHALLSEPHMLPFQKPRLSISYFPCTLTTFLFFPLLLSCMYLLKSSQQSFHVFLIITICDCFTLKIAKPDCGTSQLSQVLPQEPVSLEGLKMTENELRITFPWKENSCSKKALTIRNISHQLYIS